LQEVWVVNPLENSAAVDPSDKFLYSFRILARDIYFSQRGFREATVEGFVKEGAVLAEKLFV
jgi:hypothetical protein